MAWLDDRVWCHPKLADVTDRAFRVWVHSVAYSTGFGCRGVLTVGQQKTIGSDARTRRQLIEAGLWDELGGDIGIHDWDDHNGKRDDRRVAERERMRARRAQERTANGTANSSQNNGRTDARTFEEPSRVDGSEGSEGSDLRPKAVLDQRATAQDVQKLIEQSLKGAA